MTTTLLDNLNVRSQELLVTPSELKAQMPLSAQSERTIAQSRTTIQDILNRKDHRLLVTVGPCSIHDTKAALEYAQKLKAFADEVKDTLYIVMRVYFEKPRTTVGWKGLINDPNLDGSFKIDKGLRTARQLLLDIAEIGLPTATETLDPISPQYLQDIISWSAIGARTTESQTHREMASGLSSTVGFKNGTDGGLTVAINAIKAAGKPHSFLGIDKHGQVAIISTRGNPYSHIVLRGGSNGPNYEEFQVTQCTQTLLEAGLAPNIMIDCSHANSSKNASRQPLVIADIAQQIIDGNRSIIGMMVESNLEFGNQSLTNDIDQLRYGVSITDACIDWKTTEHSLSHLAKKLRSPLLDRVNTFKKTIQEDLTTVA